MSTVKRAPVQKRVSGDSPEVWPSLKQDCVGEPAELPSAAEVHVQVLGEFGSAALVMQGSNAVEPAEEDWSELTDALGLPMTFLAGSPIRRAGSVPASVRPMVRDGDDTTDLRVLMLTRKIGR